MQFKHVSTHFGAKSKKQQKQVRKNGFGNEVSNLWKNFRNVLDNCLEKSSSVLIQNTMGGEIVAGGSVINGAHPI